MKSISTTVRLIAVLSTILSASRTTLATSDSDVPSACSASIEAQTAYSAGLRLGKSLIQRTWQSVNDCEQLDYFSQTVRSTIDSYVILGASTNIICRYTGMVDGADDELHVVWTTCGGSCCLEGQTVGALVADLYCQLSALLGGLVAPDEFIRRPVSTCGGFSDCCAQVFTDATQSQCQDYTIQPFYDVWLTNRAVLCCE